MNRKGLGMRLFEEVELEIKKNIKKVLGILILDWNGFLVFSDIKEKDARDTISALIIDIIKEIGSLSKIFGGGKINSCALRLGDYSLYITPGSNLILSVIIRR
ncbi:MAG: roadblock/LC7 domain-containing protein [Candidatus Njordarchaeales archaeon]